MSTVTQRQLAEYCGVSTWTVSCALRNDERVNRATRARVLAAAAELGYNAEQHEAARRLINLRYGKRSYTNIIGFALPLTFYQLDYFIDMFQGVVDHLMATGYAPLVIDCSQIATNPTHATWSIFERGDVDGLIISEDPTFTGQMVQRLRACSGFEDRPIVTVNHQSPGCAKIQGDHYGGALRAFRHLYGLGHRHILHFIYPDSPERITQRLTAIADGMREVGLDPDVYLHTYTVFLEWTNPLRAPNQFSALDTPPRKRNAASYQRFIAYLQQHPEITGIIALNDANALHTWHALALAGIRVPEDMSLIGFDDTTPLSDAHGENLLTSVRMPLRQIGQEAAKMLVRLVNNTPPDSELVTLPVKFVVRRSTAPARPSAM